MSPADLARLALAKRAYEAARPGEAEVQAGVRRARLALRRSKPKRRWLSKGLVLVVLAIGSLAYAKPHALGELVEQVLRRTSGAGQASRRSGLASTPTKPETTPVSAVVTQPAPTSAATTTDARVTPVRVAATQPIAKSVPAARTAPAALKPHESKQPSGAVSALPAESALSEWGRVGQALASGDERAALAGLNELAESDDPRTRDKADLGRAQLLLAHGNRDRACALARALTTRGAGVRIERQAQALLKSCTR